MQRHDNIKLRTMDSEKTIRLVLIFLGCLAFFIVIALCIYLFCYRRRQRKRFHELENGYNCHMQEFEKEQTEREGAIEQLQIQTKVNKDLEKEIEQLQGKLQVKIEANVKADKRILELEKRYKAHKRELKRERTDKESTIEQLQKQTENNKVLKKQNIELQKKLQVETDAKVEALTRLSEKISHNLTDNNPNIADLSDINRPTNLVEKFSTLYDDEWTEAFNDLKNIPGYNDEKKVIQQLLVIIMDCFHTCRDIASEQLEAGLRMSNSNIQIRHLPSEFKKIIKDTRKKNAEADLPMIHERITKKVEQDRKELLASDQVVMYIKRCTEISWLMAIQDPPMNISTVIREDFTYDKLRFKEYTKSGAFVDFVVWPAVLTHDGGNLMSKGIVQCRN